MNSLPQYINDLEDLFELCLQAYDKRDQSLFLALHDYVELIYNTDELRLVVERYILLEAENLRDTLISIKKSEQKTEKLKAFEAREKNLLPRTTISTTPWRTYESIYKCYLLIEAENKLDDLTGNEKKAAFRLQQLEKEFTTDTDSIMERFLDPVVYKNFTEHFKRLHSKIKRGLREHLNANSLGTDNFHITKKGTTFYYKNIPLKTPINTQYYQAFNALYSLVPTGGSITYKEYKKEFKKLYLKPYRNLENKDKTFKSWAQNNLTDKSKGILNKIDFKELIVTNEAVGFTFNNKK